MVDKLPSISLSSGSRPAGHLSDYSRTIRAEGANFKELADAITAGSTLSVEVVQVEAAMADIRVTVQFSNLASKKVMLPPVLECILAAKNSTQGLQKLTSKVGGAVDRLARKILLLHFANLFNCTVSS
jgi:hypothetical protein